jgi:2OG-Fe(II) oxygenase superfamily
MNGQSSFQIGQNATRFADAERVPHPRFARDRALLCRAGIEPSLLGRLIQACDHASFVSKTFSDIGHRWTESPPLIATAISIALNRPDFMRWLMNATICGQIDHVSGHLAQSRAGGQDQLDWHNDTHANYRLGVTVHLSDCKYGGGIFELRDFGSKEILFSHSDPRPGDVVLFSIDPWSEHRVTAVEHGGPRLVYSGWFMAGDVA